MPHQAYKRRCRGASFSMLASIQQDRQDNPLLQQAIQFLHFYPQNLPYPVLALLAWAQLCGLLDGSSSVTCASMGWKPENDEVLVFSFFWMVEVAGCGINARDEAKGKPWKLLNLDPLFPPPVSALRWFTVEFPRVARACMHPARRHIAWLQADRPNSHVLAVQDWLPVGIVPSCCFPTY